MSSYQQTSGSTGIRSVVFFGLAVWLAIALFAVLAGWLRAPAGQPPLAVAVAAGAPVLIFLGLYASSRALREFVLGLDPRLLAAMQGWRVLGGMFLVLYAFGLLPGLFAFPAGLGDVAIGVTAPWVTLALIRRPEFLASRTFIVWNLLGIFDFVVAVGTGVLASGVVPAFAPGLTTAAMNAWPLAMIPGFLVPLFAILHLIAIFQARRAAA